MLGLLRGASFRPAGKTTRRRDSMRASKAVEAAPAAERDPRIEQASRPLDLPNTMPIAFAPSALDDLDAAIVSGVVRALKRRAHRQAEIAAAAGDRSGEGVIARRLAATFAAAADELEARRLS